jgi:hypothetical protein
MSRVLVLGAGVSGLAALHHDGQTFITWTNPPGSGWGFWVHRSSSPIETPADLLTATMVGGPGDSSWCDRRLSSLSGNVYGFAVDSLAAPLDSTRGLFVWTPDSAGLTYYAVTSWDAQGNHDSAVTPGVNSLVVPVSETPAPPRPVYQRTLIGPGGIPADVYTLWTSFIDTPFLPAMCNLPSEPYDCSIHRGAPGGGLMFHAHVRGGSFYLAGQGSGEPGEWQLTMDDYLRAWEANTFWFGYHEYFDINSNLSQPPLDGTVRDYTARRVSYTLDWARRTFPVDTARVYVMGNSMGGIAGVFLAMWRPDLIAATMVTVPLFDFSFMTDSNPSCGFDEDGGQRLACDRLWGTVPTGLLMDDGTPVYERLNAGAMARSLESRWVPPIIAFSGRQDTLLGWSEKIPFYRAMRESHAGGTFFWDTRTHSNTAAGGAWWPLQDHRYLYRFRTDLSFPALSNCSADGDPGDGDAASGDSIGTINGFAEWDDQVVDTPGEWQVRLRLRGLPTLWGPVVPAPDSATVDVTPRRIQRFEVTPGAEYGWQVVRSSDSAIVQLGTAMADASGVLTIPGVMVFRAGSLLKVGSPLIVGVGSEPARGAPGRPMFGAVPSPLRYATALSIQWPGAGSASVDLLDAAGRRVRSIFRGSVEPGRRDAFIDPAGLSSGIYFVRARQGGAAAVLRIAMLR